jgi:hypothetical protein
MHRVSERSTAEIRNFITSLLKLFFEILGSDRETLIVSREISWNNASLSDFVMILSPF